MNINSTLLCSLNIFNVMSFVIYFCRNFHKFSEKNKFEPIACGKSNSTTKE